MQLSPVVTAFANLPKAGRLHQAQLHPLDQESKDHQLTVAFDNRNAQSAVCEWFRTSSYFE